MIEIYWNENRSLLLTEDTERSEVKRLDCWDSDSIQQFDAAIAMQKPKEYKALCEVKGYGPKHAFDRVYQFSACNFSTRDGRPDIDDHFNFTVERVQCPVRHICTNGFCASETLLSNREIEIVKLFAKGCSEESISMQLFIAKSTVHNHITNIYHKLGFTGNNHPDRMLLAYAHANKII
jgi:DNA-binding CsgD family transcriptional regulator